MKIYNCVPFQMCLMLLKKKETDRQGPRGESEEGRKKNSKGGKKGKEKKKKKEKAQFFSDQLFLHFV